MTKPPIDNAGMFIAKTFHQARCGHIVNITATSAGRSMASLPAALTNGGIYYVCNAFPLSCNRTAIGQAETE
jgi:hypothetical protein